MVGKANVQIYLLKFMFSFNSYLEKKISVINYECTALTN